MVYLRLSYYELTSTVTDLAPVSIPPLHYFTPLAGIFHFVSPLFIYSQAIEEFDVLRQPGISSAVLIFYLDCIQNLPVVCL